MTPRLPQISARELFRALERTGFETQRKRGSHLTLRHPVSKRTVVVPVHPGDVKRPLLKMIITQAGLTEDELAGLI